MQFSPCGGEKQCVYSLTERVELYQLRLLALALTSKVKHLIDDGVA